jgi:hypothetical protein
MSRLEVIQNKDLIKIAEEVSAKLKNPPAKPVALL